MTFVVDASALLAVFLQEPDADEYAQKLLDASTIYISPVNWWEVQVNLRNVLGEPAMERAVGSMKELGIAVEPITMEQAAIAVGVRGQFGGRPARLNLGDCFAYALAASKKLPLLYKGGDFSHTGIPSA